MSENKNMVEAHGCIVCAKIFNVLAIYSPDGRLVDSVVTSPGGKCIPDERQALVVCKRHSAEEIEAAYTRWQARNGDETDNLQDDE
jgi:hypothetical protein